MQLWFHGQCWKRDVMKHGQFGPTTVFRRSGEKLRWQLWDKMGLVLAQNRLLATLETRWSNTEERRQFLSTYLDYKKKIKNAAASMLRLAYTI